MVGSVVSAKIGGSAMTWHFRFGYVVFGLLLFRLVWGLVGGRWSRFASFIYAPSTIWRYLRGSTKSGNSDSQGGPASPGTRRFDVGHNPLGSLSVFALLGFLAFQVATGLISDDEIANLGPLNRFVSSDLGLEATSWHKSWGQWILLGLVGLHVLAIAFYFLRKHNLVRPMLSGSKQLPADTPASADGAPQRLLAVAVAAGSAAVVYVVVNWGR